MGCPFGVKKTVWNYIEVLVAQHYDCTKCYWIVQFKMVDSILYKITSIYNNFILLDKCFLVLLAVAKMALIILAKQYESKTKVYLFNSKYFRQNRKYCQRFGEKNSNKLHSIRGFLLKKSTDVSKISQVMIWVESASIIKQKMLLFHVWSI